MNEMKMNKHKIRHLQEKSYFIPEKDVIIQNSVGTHERAFKG